MSRFEKVSDEVVIAMRDATDSDIAFIFSSWLKSFRNGLMNKMVDNSIYFAEHHKVVERILARAKLTLAVNPEAPEDIYGYICHEKIDNIFCLHYVYVKQPFRRRGVMKALMNTAEHDFKTAGVYSHSNYTTPIIMEKRRLYYHPYILLNHITLPADLDPQQEIDQNLNVAKRREAGGDIDLESGE